MSEALTFTVAPTKVAPVGWIRAAEPCGIANCAKCEMNINLGIFFDGTNNNRDVDKPDLKHTNIVRLWETYKDEPVCGYFRVYVPGVGTEFRDVRERGTSLVGAGFGKGGEARVLYALLAVMNAIHRAACDGQPFLSNAQVASLCCCGFNPAATYDIDELAKLGQCSGLQMGGLKGHEDRDKILQSLAGQLKVRLAKTKPIVKECFIDVFGFSRGAAQARVFCHWLNRVLDNEQMLAGVRIQFRFLGIMDTVASAGLLGSVIGNGHGSWAHPDHLRILPSVLTCVHMVAMHELRKNFPLDTVMVDGMMLPNCREFAYPGTHSDVGGGYAPCALGVSVGKDKFESDALKLAQIPLNHMFECAKRAGAPLFDYDAHEVDANGYDAFAIAPALQTAYDEFLDQATTQARPVKDWLQPYLNWRWDRRDVHASLAHVRKASEEDRALLIEHNRNFVSDMVNLQRKAKPALLHVFSRAGNEESAGRAGQEKESIGILQIAQQTSPDECMRFHQFFDGFVHDSLAGFNMRKVESDGHWRYRKGFLGSDQVLTVDAEVSSRASKAA